MRRARTRRQKTRKVFAAWLVTLLVLSPVATRASALPGGGLQRNVVFADYPPFADNAELLRRLVSPLNAYRIKQQVAAHPQTLQAQPLDPRQQHFTLYVPPGPVPSNGYALLVFVPPWNAARVPQSWIPVLDRQHAIFVSAANSGNDANVLDRREPLALLAEYNVAKHYRIDPARVYVGGFSGGSRIALRLALAYPDIFRGALLDAGSDPIGTAQIPLPPANLLHRFQTSTRIVFLTGDRDPVRQAMAARARDSLQHWCAFDHDSISMQLTGHVLASAGGFGQALKSLAKPIPADPAKLSACRARNTRALHTLLAKAQQAVEHRSAGNARNLLQRIDARYGGLAAPRSVQLLQSLDARH